MKYRKKPVIIEAYKTDKEVVIHTLEGDMKASIGDYIITGVNGEKYPCKPDIFDKTYELVTNTNYDHINDTSVEEMANDLNDCITEFVTDTLDVYVDDEATAQKMFDKGYRKQSEIVKEIFDEIKAMPKKFTEKSQDFEFGYKIAIQEILAQLKKKYSEELGNDR